MLHSTIITGDIKIKELTLLRHKSFHSMVIQFPNHTTLSNNGRFIIDQLICSDINSANGIRLSLDKPLNNPPMLNILRPAVLRQYYSLNVAQVCKPSNTVRRFTYGSGTGTSSVGMDPRNFVTRVMTEEMICLSQELHELLLKNRSYFKLEHANLTLPFNHCTVIVYYAGEYLKESSKLGMHSDCVYSVSDGSYVKKDNSQIQNTPTVIYSLGDTRCLHWRRRQLLTKSNGRTVWDIDKEFRAKFELSHDSVTIVNTLDEDPKHMSEDQSLYQYQHGNVNVSKDQFSVGIVFRTVHRSDIYDRSSDIMMPPDGLEPDMVQCHLGTDLNVFHSKLINLYHNVMF